MRISDWSSDVCSSDLIVEHPEKIPCPPGIAAHHKEARGIERDIGAAVLGVGKVDAPHRPVMIARFEVRLGQYADLLDRRLVHHRRDLARPALINAHVLAGCGIDAADALGRSKLINPPGAELAPEASCDRFPMRHSRATEKHPAR